MLSAFGSSLTFGFGWRAGLWEVWILTKHQTWPILQRGKSPDVWILAKNNPAQKVQVGKRCFGDGHLFGALGGERAQIFPHVERMSYFYPMCCDCLRPPAMLWGCLRLSVIVCHRLPLVLCNSSCPQMGKGKRPACLHQPNLYLEPKWLR